MGRMSIWLDVSTEDSVRKYAEKYEISFGAALARAWLRYLKHQKGESKLWKEYLERIEAKDALKTLREDGQLIQREIVYGEINLKRALDALEESSKSKEQKRFWKKKILKQSIERRNAAKVLTKRRRS